MGHGAAQLLCGDVLAGDGFDDLGTGDEHVGGLIHHEDEVGEGGGVDRAAGAGAHDGGDLGHHAGGPGIAVEDAAVAGQRVHSLLDAGAAGVVEADDGCAHLHGQVQHLPDLLGMHLAQRAAHNSEVLGIDIHKAVVNGTVAGDHALAGGLHALHTEVGAAVLHESIQLHKAVGVQQRSDALPGGHLTGSVLLLPPLGAAAGFDLFASLAEIFDSIHIACLLLPLLRSAGSAR